MTRTTTPAQDYGYWYSDPDRLTPELISCSVAIEYEHPPPTRIRVLANQFWTSTNECCSHDSKCTVENGCLTVLRGSHKLGRLEHAGVDGQTNADPERVQAVIKAGLEVVPCVMEPGGERALWSLLRCGRC